MGWLKKKLKQAWRFVKATIRYVFRGALTLLFGIAQGAMDLVLGGLLPQKKLRIHVVILANANYPPADATAVQAWIEFARVTFAKRFNVKLLPYGSQWYETLDVGVPDAAMRVGCKARAHVEEIVGDAGEFFNGHLAGWNIAPVSGTFPVTVFIVSEVAGKFGCSLGPLTDYVTIGADAIGVDQSIIAHELGHACNLWHSFGQSNLMYSEYTRGDTVHWWQRTLFRSSRHVLWW
jgi:hypothetical protein